MSQSESTNTVKTAAEIEKSPGGLRKRWLAELDLADGAEKDWRSEAQKVWDLYQSKEKTGNSFNILWSNTETMRPAIYNSSPKPDVRRRFRDEDPVGKTASQIIERSLSALIDTYDFDYVMQMVVLDLLLPGRGLARIKYEPKFKGEVVASETVECAHVAWNDFRRGPGKRWAEVPWVAFRHEMMFDQLAEMFGEEVAKECELTDCGDLDKTKHSEDVRSLLKVCEVWEIWDRAQKRVIFLSNAYETKALGVFDDPLQLEAFFPIPRPCYAIEDSTSLAPAIPYEKYRPQAEELNRVTARINKIVAALKVRGAYSSHLSEIAQVIEADDNQMIPIQNASEIANMKGLENAIWIMPIDKLVTVLEGLYEARNATIQAIYEITGLSDIMRGASNPHETLGAQQIKSQWGSLRLQRMQREVQRFIRDLLRLKAEVAGEHFSAETFQQLTSMRLPTPEEKMQAQQVVQMSQQAQQAPEPAPQQPGAPTQAPAAPQIPPDMIEAAQEILKLPTWDDALAILKSDKMRAYRIDIETDSTVEETLMRDSQGMQEAITAIVNLGTGMGPAIQAGLLSVDVFKALAGSVARTVRMGSAVEDAIEKIKQPPPAPPAAPPDHTLEIAQIKAQSDQRIAAAKTQSDQALAQQDAQLQTDLAQQKWASDERLAAAQHDAKTQLVSAQEEGKRLIAAAQEETKRQVAQAQNDAKAAMESSKQQAQIHQDTVAQQMSAHAEGSKAQLDAATKVIVAHIGAIQKDASDQRKAETDKSIAASSEKTDHAKTLSDLMAHLQEVKAAAHAPRKVSFEKDAKGRVIGATSSVVSGIKKA